MQPWWKNAVGYQIYPRSFMDSNQDGIGDLEGIRQKLSYLKELGVDFIWLNPIYSSPNKDNGYDISDYQGIHPNFGTMTDFKRLLTEAHELGLKIIMDLVINHTSDQHPWFIEARKSLDNPYRDYYHWVDATEETLPNNWQSFFGGSTWTYDPLTKQAYFHTFAKEQPDLNWKNPKVRAEIYQMIRWWLDLGIDGFRLDAISHIQKEPWTFMITDNQWAPFMNVAGIEDYMSELKEIFDSYNILTVGEASGVTADEAVTWTGENGYVSMIFELEHTARAGAEGSQKGELLHLKSTLARWQNSLADEGWNALYLENHDVPRSVSVFGDGSAAAAKALATVLLLLRGTPFIYQGQELGMTNANFKSIEALDAQDTHYFYHSLLAEGKSQEEALKIALNWSRDHSRTPFQWDASEFAGFSEVEPWLQVNENKQWINAAVELANEDSVLNYYKKLIALRKRTSALFDGRFELLLADDPHVFAYLRVGDEETWLVVANLGDADCEVVLPDEVVVGEWEEVITTHNSKPQKSAFKLSRFEALILRKKI